MLIEKIKGLKLKKPIEVTVEKLYTMAGIIITPTQLIISVVTACIIAWSANFIFQWWLGNEIDKKDLIAIAAEIGNRRNKL